MTSCKCEKTEVRNRIRQEVTVYECADCKDCPVKEKCIRQKKTDKTPLADKVKRLNVSKYFIRQREAMEKKISTEEEFGCRSNRSIQSEEYLP
ncbi:MAG: transposase [Clostridia bacterium]